MANTAPMGWNSYNAYYGSITEKQFKAEVDVIEKKLLPHGYEYVTIDYCWFNPAPKNWDANNNWVTFNVEQTYKLYVNSFDGMTMDKWPVIARHQSLSIRHKRGWF